MEMPANPSAEPAKKEAAPAAGQSSQTTEALKALNAGQPTPTKAAPKEKAPVPTPVPTSTPVVEKAAVPVPAVESKKETAPAAPVVAASGTFADYFPTVKGTKWSYEYLKADPATKIKKTRLVESLASEQGPGGTINATFQVTKDGKTVQEKYFLSDNKVAQTSSGDQALTGEFAFQFPMKTLSAHWNGSGKSCKAFFGKGQVYKKIYPDCVIVSEKTVGASVFSYYARGIGLVTVEVYGAGMKMDQTKSFVLLTK